MPLTSEAKERPILIAAGGTGGHLFPAQALAEALKHRGWSVHLATDHRVEGYGQDFPADKTHVIRSATFSRSITVLLGAVSRLAIGFVQSWRLIRSIRPAAAIGFGGYPTLPPMLAAARGGVPTIVHDQNAVLGRANRFLAARVDFVATSVAEVRGMDGVKAERVETGNPVRPAVADAAEDPYPARQPGAPFRLLVFGGSQGARFFSELMPEVLPLLSDETRGLLRLTQQCRPEDLQEVRDAYAALGVDVELHSFFADLPQRMAESHLVISRSGASTCAELAAIGRPAVMVPLPGAIDHDQTANARLLDEAGGGWMIEQEDLSASELAELLESFVQTPEKLTAAAAKARTLGRLDAAESLADLVERAAGGTMETSA